MDLTKVIKCRHQNRLLYSPHSTMEMFHKHYPFLLIDITYKINNDTCHFSRLGSSIFTHSYFHINRCLCLLWSTDISCFACNKIQNAENKLSQNIYEKIWYNIKVQLCTFQFLAYNVYNSILLCILGWPGTCNPHISQSRAEITSLYQHAHLNK